MIDPMNSIVFTIGICHTIVLYSGFFLEVFPPEFVTKPEPMTLFRGKQARFLCVVNGSTPMNVLWHKDNIAISADEHYKITSDKNKYTLLISKLELNDQGTYLCKASNSVGTATCSTELKVIDKPSFVKTFESVSVAVGNPLHLECQVNEDTGVTISWMKDGKKIHNTMDCKLCFEDKTASLEIPKSKLKDTGKYTCTAANDAGSSECSSVITVQGKTVGGKVHDKCSIFSLKICIFFLIIVFSL
ncbi:hypothetical protein ACEWY4_023139 [Coilia grayii]|uniref:Ig-like domain-containing protein n=1 Tax=Coilia grayii TaxID=363190 RepID=A0ABD1J3U5_9TELE